MADLTSNNTENLEKSQVWKEMCVILAQELSEQSFSTWFKPISCSYVDNQKIVLDVPDNYFGQWLKDHYENLIKSAALSVISLPVEIEYEVVEQTPSDKVLETAVQKGAPAEKKSVSEILRLNKNYTFDQFVIGPGNRFAHAAAVAVCEAPAKNYNPLFIYGPVGLGKTHLMQSLAHEVHLRFPHFKILYITSEKFTNQLISAIQKRTTQEFRERYRKVDLLLIDDIHFLAEKEATQEEFFHTFNTLYDSHKQIVVSSDRSPKDISGLEERLVSRFGWGLVTDIQPPDFETRVAILKKKMERETTYVPDDVSFFIADKIKSNIRELEGALIRVVAFCTLTGEPVTLEAAQKVLKDSLIEEEQKITIDRIQSLICDYFNLKIADLRSKRRSKSVAFPRHIAMYLVRTLTQHSLPEIGEYFGGRDHTTVLHACQKIEKALSSDDTVKRTVDELRRMLKSRG